MKITEVSPQKNNPMRVSVFVDGEYSFSYDAADAALKGIKQGAELSEEDIQNLLPHSEFTKARDIALKILSIKSISSKNLSDKLNEKGYTDIIISRVIEELTSLGYIDDENYASMYLEYCMEKLWGKKKIRYEMQLKGIDEEIIEKVFLSYNEDDALKSMAELIKSKYASFCLSDIKTKAKITRYFASRGFDYSIIDAAIRLAYEEISDE